MTRVAFGPVTESLCSSKATAVWWSRILHLRNDTGCEVLFLRVAEDVVHGFMSVSKYDKGSC